MARYLSSRYNCFICDYDICIGCKNIFEEEYNEGLKNLQINSTKDYDTSEVQKSALGRVVCLKTLCERVEEMQNQQCIKEKLQLVDTAINTENSKQEQKDKNENTMISINGPESILLGYESIPLIDVNVDPDVSPKPERPKKRSMSNQLPFTDSVVRRGLNGLRKDSRLAGLDSPDVFHLRAPLVSWENFLTPASSRDTIE